MKKLLWSVGVVVLLAAGIAAAATTNAPAEDSIFPLLKTDGITCKLNADIRIREEHFNNIPIVADPPGITRGGENDYFRYRTRIGETIGMGEDATLGIRLVNEFRKYDRGVSSWKAPDETVVDQLYLELRNVLGLPVDAKIGRQEMIYGTGKVILEGTPKDGSRTIYFDAIKLTIRPDKSTVIDLLGIYDRPENDLAFSSEHRDLTGFDKVYNDLTESGAGIYAKNNTLSNLPFEAYYLYKNESHWVDARTNTIPSRDVHTVGVRVMPVLVPDSLSANLEVAYQLGSIGDRDCSGYMLDGAVKWMVPVVSDMNPALSAGFYMLSGDDPATADDEGWNPLWARYPQFSELYVYAFDAEAAGRWSNLTMPHVDLSMAPMKDVSVTAMAAWLGAMENNGPGIGKDRGMLYVARVDATLARNTLVQNDRLFGHVILEVLDPGNYYNVTDTAYFFRWEVSYAF